MGKKAKKDPVIKKLFKAIGFAYPTEKGPSYMPVTECHGDEVYIKFMSDDGVNDDDMGFALQSYLAVTPLPNGTHYNATRPRALMMAYKDFKKLFGKLDDEDDC